MCYSIAFSFLEKEKIPVLLKQPYISISFIFVATDYSYSNRSYLKLGKMMLKSVATGEVLGLKAESNQGNVLTSQPIMVATTETERLKPISSQNVTSRYGAKDDRNSEDTPPTNSAYCSCRKSNDIDQILASVVSLQRDMAWLLDTVKSLQTRADKIAPVIAENINLLTENVSKVNHKVIGIDTLELEMQMIKQRIKHLEDAKPANEPSYPPMNFSKLHTPTNTAEELVDYTLFASPGKVARHSALSNDPHERTPNLLSALPEQTERNPIEYAISIESSPAPQSPSSPRNHNEGVRTPVSTNQDAPRSECVGTQESNVPKIPLPGSSHKSTGLENPSDQANSADSSHCSLTPTITPKDSTNPSNLQSQLPETPDHSDSDSLSPRNNEDLQQINSRSAVSPGLQDRRCNPESAWKRRRHTLSIRPPALKTEESARSSRQYGTIERTRGRQQDGKRRKTTGADRSMRARSGHESRSTIWGEEEPAEQSFPGSRNEDFKSESQSGQNDGSSKRRRLCGGKGYARSGGVRDAEGYLLRPDGSRDRRSVIRIDAAKRKKRT